MRDESIAIVEEQENEEDYCDEDEIEDDSSEKIHVPVAKNWTFWVKFYNNLSKFLIK